MSQQLSMRTMAGGPLPYSVLRLASAAVALFGISVLIGWHAHWTALLETFPGSASTKYNTAICFILCGGAALLLISRFERFAFVAGGFVTIFGVVTALEYFTARRFGIDELFARDYLLPSNAFPGRMSLLAANCFTLLGVGIVAAGTGGNRRWSFVVVGSLGCSVAVIAAVALVGHLVGIQAAYSWGADSHMAAHAAAAFVVLGLTLLLWAWVTAQRRNVNLSSWLPIVSSVTLMAMVAFVTYVSVAQLKTSVDWRRHTYEVLLSTQTLLGNLTDIQRGMHGYALTGEPSLLEQFRNGVNNAPKQLAELKVLTRDNPSQVSRLNKLSTHLSDVLAYAQQLLNGLDSHRMEAVIPVESADEGWAALDRTRADLERFANAERDLLVRRQAIVRENDFNTQRLLVTGSVLAPALLVLAHLMAGAEMNRRRRTEARLQVVSSLQTAILNAANYAIIATSVDGIVTSFNSTAERWLGYAAADVIGKAAPDAWYDAGEVRARARALSEELGRTVTAGFETFVAKTRLGQREEGEWTLIRKDGSRFPVWLSVTAVLDVLGNTVGHVRVIADITKRKKHDAELRLSEERFRRAFDDAPIGMALVGLAGRWLRVNRALCDMIGYAEAELLATDLQAVTHEDDLGTELGLLRQVLAGEAPSYQLEKRYVHKNGSLIFVMLSVSLVRDAMGSPVYFVKQIENITQRREIDRMKGEFISTVSHELRTPLTSIRGSLGLIDAGVLGKLPEKAEAMVKIAHQNCERLVRIINDILDVEKIKSGGLEMRIENVPVTAFLQQALAVNQGYGVKYLVRFVLEATPAGAEVLADPDRLMQVMANLLSNAAKFSARGTEVRVRASEHDTRVRIEVEDRGTGIPEEFRGRIFEKFAQADSSSSRHFEGTGLGLSITRQLVATMGGTIGFSTILGQGTIFYFELPRANQVPQLPPVAPLSDSLDIRALPFANQPVAPRDQNALPRILHVEDDKDLSKVIETALAGKAKVVTACTLRQAERLLNEGSFSVLVMDLGLPDGHGLSLLELPVLAAHPMPVVILSTTEVSRAVQKRVAAALVKSRVSEAHIVHTILSLVRQPLPSQCPVPVT